MQRKHDKRRSKCNTNEDLIYRHMSSHYRRILNAKKAVDNSPPYCFKLKRPSIGKASGGATKVQPPFENLPLTDRSISTNSNKGSVWGAECSAGSSRYHTHCVPEQLPDRNAKHSCNRMDLLDRIAVDTKNGPEASCDEGWIEAKAQRKEQRFEATFQGQQKDSSMKSVPSAKRRLQTINSNESSQKRKFEVQKKFKSSGVKGNKPFPALDGKMKASKSDAVSKLRSLRVYYPPRRKEKRNKTEAPVNSQTTLEVPNCKCTKICVCDTNETVLKKISLNPKEQSQTSSRDSAYNGGVSSLPESRSPTPDHRRKKECCCCCCEKKEQDAKTSETTKVLDNRVDSPKPPVPPSSPPPPAPPKPKNQQQESFKKMQEDALYVKFIQDITTEILDKNLYTNKALKKVMKKHIKNNLKRLHKDRMLREVENLRIQLGIPEDKSLLEFEGDGEGCTCDASKFYPIISDSEFVMPKQTAVAGDSNGSTRTRTPEKMTATREREKIASASETDCEGVSTSQAEKSVRERHKEKTARGKAAVKWHNSSDDSDRPSDPKKRSFLKNRKQKYARNYSPTSSDSEMSDGYSEKMREKGSREGPSPKEMFFGQFVKTSFLNKKNRSVSFWKNPDLNRVFEVKQKTSVSRGKDSVLQRLPRQKHKND